MVLFVPLLLAIIGFVITLYAYIVERKLKEDPTYKPACDISDAISCSKVAKSQYANLFYISNAIVGMAYYALIAVLSFFDMRVLFLIASFAGVIVSCILAYFLFFKIRSYCVVCISSYVINFLLLFLAIRYFNISFIYS